MDFGARYQKLLVKIASNSVSFLSPYIFSSYFCCFGLFISFREIETVSHDLAACCLDPSMNKQALMTQKRCTKLKQRAFFYLFLEKFVADAKHMTDEMHTETYVNLSKYANKYIQNLTLQSCFQKIIRLQFYYLGYKNIKKVIRSLKAVKFTLEKLSVPSKCISI